MNIFYSTFVLLVWFMATYFNVMILLVLIKYRHRIFKHKASIKDEDLPIVTLIMPLYNEGKDVVNSINSLKNVDYPKDKLEIILLNDGSTDNTAKLVKKHATGIIFIDNKINKGKAKCLNQGIKLAKGEFIATMDGDTQITPDVIKKALPYFMDDKKVVATTVSVEVQNPKNFLEKLIEIEYIIGLSLALKALSYFDAMYVTPGPFSMYRKSIFEEIGYFDPTSMTEDCEIAYRIQKYGYKIKCCSEAYVKTVSPNKFKELYIQRKRWYSGTLATVLQHRNLLLKPKLGAFAFIAPFSMSLVFLGLIMFVASLVLMLNNFLKSISHYYLTNFNFFDYINFSNIDLLNIGLLSIFGMLGISMTLISTFLYLKLAKKSIKKRKIGFIGFLLMFFLYQLFWAVSIYAVIFKRKVKWR